MSKFLKQLHGLRFQLILSVYLANLVEEEIDSAVCLVDMSDRTSIAIVNLGLSRGCNSSQFLKKLAYQNHQGI